MKRFIGWLCAVLLLLTPVLSACGEQASAPGQSETLTVLYLHATKDDTLIKTAKYVIYALNAGRQGRSIVIDRVDDEKNKLVFETADSNSLSKLINKDKVKTGSEQIQNKILLQQLAAAPSDLWLIVPQEACANLVLNSEMMNQFRGILDSQPQSRIHLVMIGDSLPEPAENTALAELKKQYADRVGWIRIASDFLAQSRDLSADGTVHTGDYFLASFYGNPVDLTLAQGEAGLSFNLPEDGRVFILQRHTGTAVDPVVTDAQGAPRAIAQKLDLQYKSTAKNDGINYTGALLTQLPAGNYTLGSYAGDVKVYWYPNVDALQPVLSMGDDNWNPGEHEVTLSLGNALYRPEDFWVYFEVTKNEGASVKPSIAYNPERNLWVYTDNVTEDIERVTVVPEVTLRMKDGNQVWSWSGKSLDESITHRDLVSAGVSVRQEAPQETVLYFLDTQKGTIRKNWSEYFRYNVNEQHTHDILKDEAAEAGSLHAEQDDTGFTLSLEPGEEGGEGTLTLKFDDQEHSLKVRWVNARDVFDTVEFTSNADHDAVKAGKDVTLKAVIPAETLEAWKAATEQLNPEAFPGPDELLLRGTILKDGEPTDLTAQTAFTETGETRTAEIRITLPEDYADGEISLAGFLMHGVPAENPEDPEAPAAEPAQLYQTEKTVRVRNSAPYAVAAATPTDLSLDGMPGSFQPKSLTEALGTENLFSLFNDDETEITEIAVSVTNPAGLQLNDEAVDAKTDPWTVTLRPGETLALQASEPGEHEISLTASDGVNSSEPLTIKVKVYSKILRIAMIAAAAIALLVFLLILFLVIRQIRKPQFADMKVRCLVTSDDSAERSRELMARSQPASLSHFGKKAVPLTDLLILTRQPAAGPEVTEVTDDILLLPTKHHELNVLFGKKAMERIGRHEKRELVTPDKDMKNILRLRIDNTYIQIQNVQ